MSLRKYLIFLILGYEAGFFLPGSYFWRYERMCHFLGKMWALQKTYWRGLVLSIPLLALVAFSLGEPSKAVGENLSPCTCSCTITNFKGVEGPNRIWTFTGTVTGTGCTTVTFGGLPSLKGLTAPVLANGTFSLSVQLQPGEGGTAWAQIFDENGQSCSNKAMWIVNQT